MGSPTLGMQTAAILSFIAMMMLLEPVMILVLPHATAMRYFGKTGLVNNTYSVFQSKFQVPVLQQANSTSGFGAASNLQISFGLAFIYGALGLFWQSLTNFWNFEYVIFTNLSSNVAFVPAAVTTIAGVIFLSYIVIGNFYKLLSMWMKSDAENVGS